MSRPTFNRSDTLLGVCEALGQDTGLPPTVLRIALAVGLLWSPAAMVAIYLALGIAVLIGRALSPEPKVAAVVPAVAPMADNDDEGTIVLAEAA